MSNNYDFIRQKLPTFEKAWRLLTYALGLLFRIRPLYSTAAIMAIAVAVLLYNIHAWRLLSCTWFDNSAYKTISEHDEDMILVGVLRYIDSTRAGTDFRYFIDEQTYHMSRGIEVFAAKTALPCLSIRQANRKPRMLYRDMMAFGNSTDKARFVLFTQRESQEIFNGHWEDWDDFRTLYPQVTGIITLSRPGIDATGNIAIVDVGIMGNRLAGSGCVYKLHKINGSWHVVQQFYTWIS